MAFKRHARDAAARGRTIVYTTQILEAVGGFSHRFLLLDRGRVHAAEAVERLDALAEGSVGALRELFVRLREDRS